jgi:hypothetical protein
MYGVRCADQGLKRTSDIAKPACSPGGKLCINKTRMVI